DVYGVRSVLDRTAACAPRQRARFDAYRLGYIASRIETEEGTNVAAKARRYGELIDSMATCSEGAGLGGIYGRHGHLLRLAGGGVKYLDLGIECSIREGNVEMACQLLGDRGAMYSREDRTDRMWECWNRAAALARQVGSTQEARIDRLAMGYHFANGRIAMARDDIARAEQICREAGDPREEMSTAISAAGLNLTLGCPDEAMHELDRCAILIPRVAALLERPGNLYDQYLAHLAVAAAEASDRSTSAMAAGK